MTRKTIAWLLTAALVVAASALLPEVALHVQDERLARTVQTMDMETLDLDLLSDLSLADTLYLVQNARSRVVLENGRVMTEGEAGGAAADALNGIFESLGNYLDIQDYEARPVLMTGQDGSCVVLWQVTVTGLSAEPVNIAASWYVPEYADWEDPCDTPYTAAVLVDDRSGCVVSLQVDWRSPTPTAAAYPTALPTSGAEAGWPEDGEVIQASLVDLRSFLLDNMYWRCWKLLQGQGREYQDEFGTYLPDMGEIPYGMLDPNEILDRQMAGVTGDPLIISSDGMDYASWYLTTSVGETFVVRGYWDLDRLSFNPPGA